MHSLHSWHFPNQFLENDHEEGFETHHLLNVTRKQTAMVGNKNTILYVPVGEGKGAFSLASHRRTSDLNHASHVSPTSPATIHQRRTDKESGLLPLLRYCLTKGSRKPTQQILDTNRAAAVRCNIVYRYLFIRTTWWESNLNDYST